MRRLAPMLAVLLVACAAAPTTPELLKQEVADAERGFARTMAQRDFAAFPAFLADETVFFNGNQALRGKQAVVEGWKPFYEGAQAPFSWEPKVVEVLDSGTLALSSGPVYDPSGKQVSVFTSIWRREASGAWRVVFDKGCGYCPPPAPAKP
jgi:ketosteroid isomerase-like protein